MRDIRSQRRASDLHRQRVLHPRFARIAFLEWIASDPLNGTQSAEHCRQQIANRKVLDFPVATYSSDRRTLQEAVWTVSWRATSSDRFIVSAICRKLIRFRYIFESGQRQNSAHLHDVAASALNFLQVVHGDHTYHSHTADYGNALPNAITELQFCCDFRGPKPGFINKRPPFYAPRLGECAPVSRKLPTAVLASENGQSARFPAPPVS